MSEEIRKKLDEKIPRDVIAQREGGGRRKLSYLEGWYVINRLNEILGQGNWATLIDAPIAVANTEQDGRYVAAYMVKVRLEVKSLGTLFEDFGYGDGKDPHPGKAHESAIKEAVTDGIKRCAKNLGMSMGLALYDKSQENVEDEAPAPAAKPAFKSVGAAAASVPVEAAPVVAPSDAERVPEDRETVQKMIKKYVTVVTAKKLKTVDELRAEMKTKYGVSSSAELNDEQAKQLYNELKEMVA